MLCVCEFTEPGLALPDHIWALHLGYFVPFPLKSLLSVVPVALSGAWWWQEFGRVLPAPSAALV